MATQHYVNNADFLQAIKEYKSAVKDAEESGDPVPQIPEYIGDCILKIATGLSHKPNFINYTYRDDMIGDGIENCIHYFSNFDPQKSSNPFAYFTQIIYFAFVRRIQKEKRQTTIKGKIITEMPFDLFDLQVGDDPQQMQAYVELMQKSGMYEPTIPEAEKKPPKKKKAPLNVIIDD